MQYRGKAYMDSFRILRTLIRASPHPPAPSQRRLRVAVMTGGAPAPGMNAATRAVVRLLVDSGHIPLGVKRGLPRTDQRRHSRDELDDGQRLGANRRL